MSRIQRPRLFDIYPALIREGATKPEDLPTEVSQAWDLSAAGLTCRLGRIVIRKNGTEEGLEIDPEVGDFLADMAKHKTLRDWSPPVYLGPAAMPCHNGTLTVTLEHGDERVFRGVGLWVPEGNYSTEGFWVPDTSVQVDHTHLEFDQVK